MKNRVTITLDPEIHHRAKRIARTKHTTVSGLLESLVKSTPDLVNDRSKVDEMIGCAELRAPAPGSDPLYDALRDRYLG